MIEDHFPQTALLSDTLQIYEIVRQSHVKVNFDDIVPNFTIFTIFYMCLLFFWP